MTLIRSVLLYGVEIWVMMMKLKVVLIKCDKKMLSNFKVQCKIQ